MIAPFEPTPAGQTTSNCRAQPRTQPFRVSDFGLRTSALPKPLALLAALLSLALPVCAQLRVPRVGYVYPAGGQQGTTFQVTVGGQYLNNASSAFVSGPGVKAAFVSYARPLTQKEFNDLRDKLRELQQKRIAAARSGGKRKGPASARSGTNVVWTAADEKLAADIREKLFLFAPRRNQNPAIAETAILRITLAANAEPGEREIRLASPSGLSNPLQFRVGQLPEFTKRDTKTVPDEATLRQRRFSNEQKAVASTEMNITLPATVNGQILPGGVDRYRFQARKGQKLVVAVAARELIPYLPDAVPGWFQAALALYDAKGQELAHADHYLFHPDPVIHYEILKDGEYAVEIRDSIYRGREDFVYRITVGEVPYVTSIFPLGGPAEAQTAVEVKGWNLPVSSLTLSNGAPGIYPLAFRAADGVVNGLPFAVDNLPEHLEQEPNNTVAAAQPVTLPIVVNGRIGQPGECDVFADSYLTATLPAEGTYYLHLGDAQRQGGPEHAYRLRISPPRPDFALRVVPSSINVRGGASVPLTVYALRRDGFTNEITLSMLDAPKGFKLDSAKVPANQDQVRVTLQAPPTPTDAPVRLLLEGRAFVQGHPLVRPAVPAEDMMQAFAYRHLVPAKGLEVAVSGRFMNRMPLKILSSTPVRIPAGGTARVRVSAPGGGLANRVRFELNEPPDGIALGKVSPVSEGTEIELRSDASKSKPGLKGNLIVNILPGQAVAAAAKTKKQGNQPRAAVGTLPAIAFEVVAP